MKNDHLTVYEKIPSVAQQLAESEAERVVKFPGSKKVINQELKVAQQVIKEAAAAGGNVTININYSPVATQTVAEAKDSPGPTVSDEYRRNPSNFDLLDFVEQLPAPRIDNLQRALMGMAVLKYGSQAKAATALGVSRRVVGYWIGGKYDQQQGGSPWMKSLNKE